MKELCKHYSVTHNFHSMVTLGNIIQSGDIHPIIVRNNFASSPKIAIWGSGDEDLLVSHHLCKTAVTPFGHSFYVFTVKAETVAFVVIHITAESLFSSMTPFMCN